MCVFPSILKETILRKCDNLNCCTAVRAQTGEVPSFLPDPLLQPDKEHFKPLSDVLSCETTEADMPSGKVKTVAKVAEEQQVCFYCFSQISNIEFTSLNILVQGHKSVLLNLQLLLI